MPEHPASGHRNQPPCSTQPRRRYPQQQALTQRRVPPGTDRGLAAEPKARRPLEDGHSGARRQKPGWDLSRSLMKRIARPASASPPQSVWTDSGGVPLTRSFTRHRARLSGTGAHRWGGAGPAAGGAGRHCAASALCHRQRRPAPTDQGNVTTRLRSRRTSAAGARAVWPAKAAATR